MHECSPKGQHADIGAYGNKTAYNALKRWADYVAIHQPVANAYSVIWAPERVLRAEGENAAELIVGAEFSLSCDHKQPLIGDIVYLLRYEPAPKGFVAKAEVTRQTFDAPYWKDTDKNMALHWHQNP